MLRGKRGRRPHAGQLAGWGFCALLFFVLAPHLRAEGTPAGTQIKSWAEITYEAPNGLSYTAVSDTLVFVVAQVAGVDLGQ